MFVQTEITPNPNSLKFLPGKIVSNCGSFEITKKDNIQNELIRNLLSVNGVEGIFLSKDFISVTVDDLASEWLKIMAEKEIGCLAVMKDKALVGIINQKDLVKLGI